METNIIHNRKTYIDFMRIIACFLVIFNHLDGYSLYMNTGGKRQFFYMCLTMITRLNVPIFYMISGVTLLGKEEEWKTVFQKRIIKILLLLLIFNFSVFICNKVNCQLYGHQFSYFFGDFFRGLIGNTLRGSIAYHFLYAYLSFLFVLPFMQRIAKGFTKNEFIVLIILNIIFSTILPIANLFFEENNIPGLVIAQEFYTPFTSLKQFFFPLIGYYLDKKIDIKNIKLKYLLGIIILGFVGIIISNICTLKEATIRNEYSQHYVGLFDYLSAIVFFIVIKYIFEVLIPKINEKKISKIICLLGSTTIGVYLLEPCFKLLLFEFYNNWIESLLTNIYYNWQNVFFIPLIPTLVWMLLSFSLGVIITIILRLIPKINKIL